MTMALHECLLVSFNSVVFLEIVLHGEDRTSPEAPREQPREPSSMGRQWKQKTTEAVRCY